MFPAGSAPDHPSVGGGGGGSDVAGDSSPRRQKRHRVFSRESVAAADWIGAEIECRGLDQKDSYHKGRLLAADPVSGSLVLLCASSGCVTLVPSISSGGVKVISGEDKWTAQEHRERVQRLISESAPAAAAGSALGDPTVRRRRLVTWLRDKHRLEVDDSQPEVIIVQGCVRVGCPWGPADCEAGNEIVLDRVRELVASVPPPSPTHDHQDKQEQEAKTSGSE